MSYPEDQVEELKQICAGARQCSESGVPYFFLPGLRLPDGCSPEQVDALLCPTAHHGYSSRLFLAEQVRSPQSRNWSTTARLFERNWHAISWNFAQTNLRLAQILALQLRAFR